MIDFGPQNPIPLFKVSIDPVLTGRAVEEICRTGYLNEGTQVTELERELCRKLDAPPTGGGTLLNSCTSALELALQLSGVGPNDSVITTSMTCLATNTPIVASGADIIWADIDQHTGCIDPHDVRDILWRKNGPHASGYKPVKAVICVDWAGNVCNLGSLNELCNNYNVKLIQDAAHAFGALWDDDGVARHADFTCFSFQAIKHFTTADGGMIMCKNAEDHARARRLKWFGLDRDHVKDSKGDWRGQQWDVDVLEAGRKFNMNNIDAAIGLANLPRVAENLYKHRVNSFVYSAVFAEHRDLIKPLKLCGEDRQLSSRWVYTVRVDKAIRNKLLERLSARGIKAGLVHVPNHNYTCFSQYKRDLPGTDEFAATQLSLPCGWWIDPATTEMIANITLEEIRGIS